MIRDVTHPQCVVDMDDVAAQDSGLQFGHAKNPSLPHVTHAGDDVVAPDRSEFLAKHFGAAVRQIYVLGHDGSFWNDDPRAGVFKLSIDANVFPLAVTLPVNAGGHGNASVGNKHAGDFLLFCTCNWSLKTMERITI